MNIKLNPYIQHYVGPSQSYYIAQNRFNSILRDKLGVSKETVVSDEKNPIFFDNDGDVSEVFSVTDTSKLTKDEFSLSKALTKSVNSLSINGIIDTDDVRKKSNYTVEYLNSKLEGSPLEGLGEDFKKAEDIYGVNALILMSIAKLESNFGRSAIAMDKNNLFGYQAYDSSPYASAKTYETKQDSIYDVARHLSNNYLSDTGMYFNGYSVDGIGVKYSSDTAWASKIKRIASELIR